MNNPTAIIVANGPSLKEIDFKYFSGNIVLTSNRAYLAFKDLPVDVTHIHVVANELVAKQFHADLEDLGCQLYTLRRFSKYFSNKVNICFLDDLPGFGFSPDIEKGVFVGATVTYLMLQIAYSLGAKQVNLVGLDHSFGVTDTPHKSLNGLKDDVNHFVPNYFPKGVVWQAPDLLESELNYICGKVHFDKNGITLRNYTSNSKLDVFDRYRYVESVGFSNEQISLGVVDLGKVARSAHSGNGIAMPSIFKFISSPNFYLYSMSIFIGFVSAVVLFGPEIVFPIIISSLFLGLWLAPKLVGWVKSFRRRARIELIFTFLSLYLG